MKVLLDTDSLSAIMRQQPNAIKEAGSYLLENENFTYSVITKYEILRGLKAKDARKQIEMFLQFCATSEILLVTEDVTDKAADIYAHLYRQGEMIGDADILIGATAIVHGLSVVTNNTKHFSRIPDLEIANWLA